MKVDENVVSQVLENIFRIVAQCVLLNTDIQIGCRIQDGMDMNDSFEQAGDEESRLIFEVSFSARPNVKALLLSKEDCASFFENDHYLNLSRKLCLLLGGNLSIDRAQHGRFSF